MYILILISDGIHKTYFNAHEILLTYKIQALKNILKARQTLKKTINDKKTIEKRKTTRQDGGGGVEDMHKSSELTLIMLFPLIESVAKSDPGLCSRIAQLLVDYFKKCNPMSIKGPNVQLDEIETLLIKWTCEKDANNDPFAIEALVALACARDSIDTMIRTVHVLFNMENTSDVESKTKNLLMRVQKLDYEQPQVFDVSRHEFGFHYNSRYVYFLFIKIQNFLQTFFLFFRKKSCLNENKGCDCKELVKRSIALVEDEGYVIVSNDSGCQMAKIGTGYNDTIRGHIYAKSKCLEPGVSIEINGTLIHRPFGLDESNHDTFGYVLNPVTLERKDRISLPTNCAVKWSGVKSISILKYRNNGILWLRQVPADMETLNYLPQAAYISIIDYVNVSQDGAITFEERKILLKNPEPIETTFNILELLKKPKSKKESTVAGGGGGDQQHCVKFPSDSHSSSSGLRLATLQESAIICDDAFLTVLAPNPENSRGGGKMAKIIGTSYSFDLENAVLHSQSEMICDHSNAPLSLPKGYSMSNSTSIIYVPNTHKFWSLAYNRIDEFHGNPSSLRKTYLHRRLCNHQMISRQDYEKNGIAYNLLEHVAIQMLRSSDKIILKTHSVQSLIDIASRNITKQSPLILEMLKKIANFDDTDCETLQPLLLRLLHSCDVYVAEMIIKFMLEHSSSKSVTQKIKCILKNPDDSTTTMAIPVKSILRKYYLQETIDNMDFKTEPSVELLEEIDAEFKASIQETLACIKANDVYQLKISQHVSTLVNIISERVLDNEKNTFFTTLCHKAISHQKNLMEKIFNIEKKPEKNSLDAILSMSILGPTFVGTLVCAIMQHETDDDDVTENLLKSFQELFILISKFVNCTQEQEFPNLERGDHLENNLPWIFNRHIFTPHPIKEGYKFQETIKLPGVRCLYLIFDERSSTMSNEDKLTVYSGGSVGNSKKLLEFSGNSRTSKRIGQKHWPKKPILLMGDTVTFDFEVKGRQDTNHDPLLHNLNWGFECFLFHSNDLFDSVNVNTLQNALVTIGPILKEQIFYQFLGSSCSDQENICSHMLSAKILQKCHWNQSNVEHLLHFYENCNFNHEQMIPTIPSKTMSQLRALSGIALPIMRESTKR